MKKRYSSKIKYSIVKLLALCFVMVSFSCEDKEVCGYVDGFPYECNRGMDVAFLIDYTASMGGAIDDVKNSVTAISNTIVAESGGDYRLSLSIFDEQPGRDSGVTPPYFSEEDYVNLPANQKIINSTSPNTAQYLTMMEKFGVNNKTSFATQLAKLNNTMSLGSGVGFPEPGGLLLNEVLNNDFAASWRSGNITKLAIILTDAPAGGDDDVATSADDTFLTSLANDANAMGVQVILVTSLSTSNYEVSLIDNNNEGVKLMGANFEKVGADIIKLIEDVCDNNAE